MKISLRSNIYPFDSYPKKRISFLLATKNRPKFLAKALARHRSVITSKDQLIVIEGYPSTQTSKIIEKFKDIVDIFISEPDFSEGNALNKGILLAKGKYIKLLTDDDIFYKEAIDQAFEIMEKHPKIDILLCGGTKSRSTKKYLAYVPPGVNYGSKTSDIFKYGGCGLGMVIKKSVFAKTNLFNTQALSLDNDYLAQAISAGANVKFCRINMFHHFLEDHSVSIKQAKRFSLDRERIKKQYNADESDLILKIRIKASQIICPYLPKIVLNKYRQIFKKPLLIKPIWDGGFS